MWEDVFPARDSPVSKGDQRHSPLDAALGSLRTCLLGAFLGKGLLSQNLGRALPGMPPASSL